MTTKINIMDDLSEAESGNHSTASDSLLKHISDMGEEMKSLEKRIAADTERLKEIQNTDLPEAMEAVGMKSFKLLDGSEVIIKDIIAGNIPKEPARAAAAYDWLNSNGFGDLIKVEVSTQFGKGEYEKASELAKAVEQQFGLKMQAKNSVHFMTLSAWAKEQVANGADLPFDLLGIWVGKKATIK